MRIDGLPVRDIMKPISFIITEDDCRRGQSKTPSSCAAALAAKRLPRVSEARIHIGRVYLKVDKKYWLRGKTPNSLRTEIISFDRGGKFVPGEYVISPLPPSDMPGGKRQGTEDKTSRDKRRGKKKRKLHVLHSIRSNAHTEFSLNTRKK